MAFVRDVSQLVSSVIHEVRVEMNGGEEAEKLRLQKLSDNIELKRREEEKEIEKMREENLVENAFRGVGWSRTRRDETR